MKLGALGAIAGLADSASGILGAGIKEDAEMRMMDKKLDIENRLRDADEVRKQRAAEYKESMSTNRAKEINSKAEGILGAGTSEPVIGYEGDSGDVGVSGGSIPGNAEASEVDRHRARTRAAEELGYMTEAKESRAILDVERKFTADEARDARAAADLKFRESQAAAKSEADLRKAEQTHEKDMAKIAAMIGGRDKNTTVVDKGGNVRVLPASEINKGEFFPVSSVEGDRKTKQAEEGRTSRAIEQKEKQVASLGGKAREKAEQELAAMKSAAGRAAPAAGPWAKYKKGG